MSVTNPPIPNKAVSNNNQGDSTMENQQQSQTFGQKAVGLSFNPSGDDEVTLIKTLFAEAITRLDMNRTVAKDPEVKRMLSVAITEAQTAQMWAVKAVTWKL